MTTKLATAVCALSLVFCGSAATVQTASAQAPSVPAPPLAGPPSLGASAAMGSAATTAGHRAGHLVR